MAYKFPKVNLASEVTGTLPVGNGGTGATTLTNHGVVIGQATSAVAVTAAGSAGQVLQSGGASADPTYSTATFPSTATGTGTILRANGTNWVATTATYPTTTTVSQILYSSSANVIGGITTANNGLLLTSATGVPSIGNSVLGDFTFTSATAGTNRTLTISNSDNTNTASAANVTRSVGGTSAGDPYDVYAVGSTRSYCIGIDTSDSQKLKFNTTNAATVSPSSGTNVMTVVSAGSVTQPLQPAASVYVDAVISDVTGDGTVYGPVIFDGELFDQQSNYDTGTGLFTCPVAGIYRVTTTITFEQVGALFTSGEIQIRLNGATVTRKEFNPSTGLIGTEYAASDTFLINCAATNTLSVYVVVSGSTKTVDIKADNFGYFSYATFQLEC